ncbi:MAG: hypothetical protein AB1645_06575 [Bacillota bacterium]
MGFLRRLGGYFYLGSARPPEFTVRSWAVPSPVGDRPEAPCPADDQRRQALYTVLHYLALVLGVLAKFFIETASRGGTLSWVTVASSVILAAVAFPYVYRRVAAPGQTGAVQFFVSFQHGFFIQTVLEQVQRLI